MKTKKFGKRLALNKTTVTNLGHNEQARIVAGETLRCTDVPELCETWPILVCNSVKPNTGCAPSETYLTCYITGCC